MEHWLTNSNFVLVNVIEKIFPWLLKLAYFSQRSSTSVVLWFARSMETLEFISYPDGRVQEKVTGVVGNSCAEVTAAIEEQLGVVVNQQPTSEYFASQVQEQSGIVNGNSQAAYSDW